jgi:hypothetical protein
MSRTIPIDIHCYGAIDLTEIVKGSELTPADLLYLFCTCTVGFCRFLPIELFRFSRSFENLRIVADRLPPPPYPLFSDL